MAKCSIWNGIEYVMNREQALDIMRTRGKSDSKGKRTGGIDKAYLRDFVNENCGLIAECIKVTVR